MTSLVCHQRRTVRSTRNGPVFVFVFGFFLFFFHSNIFPASACVFADDQQLRRFLFLFDWLLPTLTGFDWLLLAFTAFNWVFTKLQLVDWVFYLVSLGLSGFEWVFT